MRWRIEKEVVQGKGKFVSLYYVVIIHRKSRYLGGVGILGKIYEMFWDEYVCFPLHSYKKNYNTTTASGSISIELKM